MFNWLPNSFLKGLSIPKVRVLSNLDFQGCYYEQQDYADDEMDLRKNALILISEDCESMAATLAHELRHHWQRTFAGIEVPAIEFQAELEFDAAMTRYYTESFTEFDALRFEYIHTKTEENDYVWGLVKKYWRLK